MTLKEQFTRDLLERCEQAKAIGCGMSAKSLQTVTVKGGDELARFILGRQGTSDNFDKLAKKGRLESAGTQVLTGLQTMSYARIRKLDSDFVRVERQQKVILAIYKKLCTLPLFEIPSIITRNISRVDTNVTLARAASLAGMIVGFDEVTFTTLRIPANGAYRSQTISGTYFIVPKLERCRTDIQTFLDE